MPSPLLTHTEETQAADVDDFNSDIEDGQRALLQVERVDHLVRDLLAQWQHPSDALERRGLSRIGFQKQIALFAYDNAEQQVTGEPWLVTGKDISLQGVSFSHIAPLPFSKVAIGFEVPGGFSRFVITRLSWCRFTRRGVYESGGTFLRSITLPKGFALDASSMQRI
jgi:hypothetical protein